MFGPSGNFEMLRFPALLLLFVVFTQGSYSQQPAYPSEAGYAAGPPPGQLPHLLVRPPPMMDKHGRLVDPRYAAHGPAVIPYSESQGVWRSPYAYGYFGARPAKHWSVHHGVRETYRQWTSQ
jgi:hypothetical protein